MIRIDALWLATAPVDMRAGAERLLARVVEVFGCAQAHQTAGARRLWPVVRGTAPEPGPLCLAARSL